MHPAYSVIIFTIFSGAGYGLAALLGLGLVEPTLLAAKVGHFLGLALIATGLLSSALHLGNPKNAIWAFSQWRSSWLSREGVLAIVTFLPLTAQAFLTIFFGLHIVWLGYLSVVLCLMTVFSTSMIYASIRSIAVWNHWLTPACYMLYSLASGLVLLAALVAGFGGTVGPIAKAAIFALIAAWTIKGIWNSRLKNGFGGSSTATATGLGHIGKVRLLERPHSMENYLTREMGFQIARKHAVILWQIAVLLGFILPVIALALVFAFQGSLTASLLAIAAAISHMTGMMVERWLFFANAKHTVSLYYGDDAVTSAKI